MQLCPVSFQRQTRQTARPAVSKDNFFQYVDSDRSKEIKYCQLVILESPQDGGVLILSCLSPVHSPGLDQEPDVLLLPHLHGNVGQAGAGVALVQLGQNCLHKICN